MNIQHPALIPGNNSFSIDYALLNESGTIYQVQTFAGPGADGGPTAVCLLPEAPDEHLMLRTARQMNVAVTAFVFPNNHSRVSYSIRYCTRRMPIAACGHATLAAAKIIFECNQADAAIFRTAQGLFIPVKQVNGLIVMTYPQYEWRPVAAPYNLRCSLGLQQPVLNSGWCKELQTLFIETSPALLRTMQPDFTRLEHSHDGTKEVVVTSASDLPEYDYLFRSFCPWMGINEDPATGSVHSVLAGYWQQRTGKTALTAFQASPAGALIYTQVQKAGVEVSGHAELITASS
jgi:PhzF family phenazine biosynthesis protein